mmetsp:Transcript_24197/g.38911  ORF Transcript_24197/g.38911 Transcript_24197/m.38911 type:complete len:220 (+) Transcript_24197:256-915(+)
MGGYIGQNKVKKYTNVKGIKTCILVYYLHKQCILGVVFDFISVVCCLLRARCCITILHNIHVLVVRVRVVVGSAGDTWLWLAWCDNRRSFSLHFIVHIRVVGKLRLVIVSLAFEFTLQRNVVCLDDSRHIGCRQQLRHRQNTTSTGHGHLNLSNCVITWLRWWWWWLCTVVMVRMRVMFRCLCRLNLWWRVVLETRISMSNPNRRSPHFFGHDLRRITR